MRQQKCARNRHGSSEDIMFQSVGMSHGRSLSINFRVNTFFKGRSLCPLAALSFSSSNISSRVEL